MECPGVSGGCKVNGNGDVVDLRMGETSYPVPKIMWSTFSSLVPSSKWTVRSFVERLDVICVIGERRSMFGCWNA